ncbi:MAG TPA: ABC transporter substrate-binding protein [Bosea sp. (in: a-proteobacteria)]|jgi:iron complex transport system substrate-binding protein|uniref:ABC transporter substrate-binding protein n=1 Tax=Bosea sp. (in: a-proteobacteria) TaxID=1871050 RepID=UPI002E0FD4E4|nr:ABC transporter substrate-binding protein [Bosea sp. (in: a-proteobacteria)]
MRFQRTGLAFALLALAMTLALPARAERIVTDQLGRQVKIPDAVSRAVVLQHQALNIIVQLDATDEVVGILDEWKRQLGANYVRLAPRLADLPMPGGLTKVNIEALLKLRPDVVFVTHYAPPDMIKQMENSGIAVIGISMMTAPPAEAAKLNPVVADEEAAYETGFPEAIRLIGDVLNRKPQAEDLIAYATQKRKVVQDRLANLAEAQRVPVYMANPDLATYGTGKYTGLLMRRAGASNVAASINGFKQVSMEDVLKWNPAVIFVQERYPSVVDEIKRAPAWQSIAAVKAGRVYLMPEYAKAWGHPMPEALALGELWMAKTLYPDRFADIDLQAEADAYYRRFYRTGYSSFH